MSALRTTQAVFKLLDPEREPPSTMLVLSAETRMLIGMVHADGAMRAVVLYAAGMGSKASSLEVGMQRLETMASVHAGKSAVLLDGVRKALGRRRTVKALRAAARLLLAQD